MSHESLIEFPSRRSLLQHVPPLIRKLKKFKNEFVYKPRAERRAKRKRRQDKKVAEKKARLDAYVTEMRRIQALEDARREEMAALFSSGSSDVFRAVWAENTGEAIVQGEPARSSRSQASGDSARQKNGQAKSKALPMAKGKASAKSRNQGTKADVLRTALEEEVARALVEPLRRGSVDATAVAVGSSVPRVGARTATAPKAKPKAKPKRKTTTAEPSTPAPTSATSRLGKTTLATDVETPADQQCRRVLRVHESWDGRGRLEHLYGKARRDAVVPARIPRTGQLARSENVRCAESDYTTEDVDFRRSVEWNFDLSGPATVRKLACRYLGSSEHGKSDSAHKNGKNKGKKFFSENLEKEEPDVFPTTSESEDGGEEPGTSAPSRSKKKRSYSYGQFAGFQSADREQDPLRSVRLRSLHSLAHAAPDFGARYSVEKSAGENGNLGWWRKALDHPHRTARVLDALFGIFRNYQESERSAALEMDEDYHHHGNSSYVFSQSLVQIPSPPLPHYLSM